MRMTFATAVMLMASTMLLGTVRNGPPPTSQIVFTSSRDGYPPKLYLMNADGSNVRRLGSLPGWHAQAEFGPGNRRIVFCYQRPSDSDWQVYSMKPDGSDVKMLTSPPGSNADARYTFEGRIMYLHRVDEGRTISATPYVMDEDGSHSARLSLIAPGIGQVSYPAFGPRGLIAFATFERPDIDDPGANQIYTMTVDGRQLRRLTNPPESSSFPAWSPDGLRIAFANEGTSALAFSGRQPHHERDGIYIMNADGSRPVRVASMDFGQTLGLTSFGIPGSRELVRLSSPPSFSQDGARLTYAVNSSGRHQVYVINVDGTGMRQLTEATGESKYPSFSR